MKKIKLVRREHDKKNSQTCPELEPNVTEDCLFEVEGKTVGFYLTSLPAKAEQLLSLANAEFLSDRVPKTMMSRGTKEQAEKAGLDHVVKQFSTILGSVPKKPVFKRNYITASSVHQVATAQNFIKAMFMACGEAEKIIKELMPDQHKAQKQIIEDSISKEFRIKNLFTSSISNYNIAAPYHQDRANLKETVNVIYTKRHRCEGGCLNVPDYGITIAQADNSLLVYPAWANMHGVTPIKGKRKSSYRNSFIFYPVVLNQ